MSGERALPRAPRSSPDSEPEPVCSSQPLSEVIDIHEECEDEESNGDGQRYGSDASQTVLHSIVDNEKSKRLISVPTTPEAPSPSKVARRSSLGVFLTYDTPVRDAPSEQTYRTTPLPINELAPNTGERHNTRAKFLDTALQELPLSDVVDDLDESLSSNALVPIWGGPHGQMFRADQIFDVDDIPMYPTSSASKLDQVGTLYVINLTCMTTVERNNLHTSIMYSHQETGSGNETNVSFNDAGRMRCRVFTCRGVKLCTGLHPAIKHRHLGGASAETLLKQNASLSKEFAGAMPREVPEDFIFGPPELRLDDRHRAYIHAQNVEARCLARQFCTHTSANGTPCSGQPVVRQVKDVKMDPRFDSFGREVPAMTWILNCTQWRANRVENTHYIMWNLEQFLDVALFRTLIEKINRRGSLSTTPVFHCSAIHHFASRKLRCQQLHGTSQCKILPSTTVLGAECSVRFTLLTPVVTSKDPDRAYLYVTGGHHNHAPCPPDKTPRALWQQITNVLARLGPNVLLDRKPLAITEHPDITRVLQDNEAESLEALHPSLKPEVVANLIYRQRMISAPDGRAFAGAVSQQRRELLGPSLERYIRCAHVENNCSFVICFTNVGAAGLYSTEYIEVDLAFKRVKGAFNEMEVVTFSENPARTITHARIFMDKETTQSYKIAFRLLFNTIANELNRPVLTFKHLHAQSNLQAVVTDFDTKQAAGLGLYLQSTDQYRRSWNWHIESFAIAGSISIGESI